MNLMMNIHVRACINELEWRISQLEKELEKYLEPLTKDEEIARINSSNSVSITGT